MLGFPAFVHVVVEVDVALAATTDDYIPQLDLSKQYPVIESTLRARKLDRNKTKVYHLPPSSITSDSYPVYRMYTYHQL